MSESVAGTSVIVREGNGESSFQINDLSGREQIESLCGPQSGELLEMLSSASSDNLLPRTPEIEQIDSQFAERPSLYRPKSSLDFDVSLGMTISLFEPLGGASTDGKDYDNTRTEQESIFGETSEQGEQGVKRVRKAYASTKTPYSTSVRLQNFWDLIFPLLQPPLTLDPTEQFDLYQPLYGYQQNGVEFLVKNKSALLADEMGTGKTVQSIVALRILFRQARIKHALVICPPAVLGSAYLSQITGKPEGWDGHFYKWAPELSVTVVRGSQDERTLDWSCPAHVYIATYDNLRDDLSDGRLRPEDAKEFDCVLIDEASNIKNHASGRARAVRKLSPVFRWALTGTPIENKVDDVISIFEFVKPKLFTRNKQYYSPDDVREIISPYFMRRLKRDVLKDLPEKVYQEEWLELDGDQRAAYNQVLATGQSELSDKLKSKSEFEIRRHIFVLLQALKQICNFAPKKGHSPKTEALMEYVETIAENRDKVLIFSQYSDYGIDRLQNLFDKKSVRYVTYKGGMSDRDRDKAIQSFKKNPDVTVFLGAVRAAGYGLTLTEASYVIHFDHWWNPAVMWQAEDRAHRPGQTNKLNVYSFWMKDTIEEKIKSKLHEKGLLIQSVIDSLAVDAVEESITTEEWLDMLGVDRGKQSYNTEASGSVGDILRKLRNVSPIEFEGITREFFVRQGYTNSKVTQRSHDGGIDVFGSRTKGGVEDSFIAQCKRTDSVGVKVARELLGVLAANPQVTKGFLITSGVFTEECRQFSEGNPKLALINGVAFANFLRQFKIM